MKKILLGLAALVVIGLAGGAIWLYSSLETLVQAAIEKYGTEIIQAPVKVGGVKLSPAEGAGAIVSLRIGNPKGFRTDHAIAAKAIELAVDPASITRDVVLIRRIALVAPDINYETTDAGSNFDAIQKNVERYVGPGGRDKQPGRKLIVEHLSIRNAKVSYAPAALQGKVIAFSLPNIEMRNIGKAKGGATPGELVDEILGVLKAQILRSLNQSVKGAAESIGNAARGLGDKVKGLFK